MNATQFEVKSQGGLQKKAKNETHKIICLLNESLETMLIYNNLLFQKA